MAVLGTLGEELAHVSGLVAPVLLPALPGLPLTTGGGSTLDDGSGNAIFAKTVDATGFHSTGPGSGNEAFGLGALLVNATGGENTAFGTNALRDNTASDNHAFGWEALAACTSGGSNTAFGGSALQGLTTGFNNSAFGNNVLKSLTTGENNIVVGIDSGYAPLNNTAFATVAGNGNTFVGFQVGAGDNSDPSYTTALGHFATVIGSGSMALGCDHTGAGAAALAEDQIVIGTALHTTRIPGLPAFVAGDHYVVADTNGDLHVSALGPLS